MAEQASDYQGHSESSTYILLLETTGFNAIISLEFLK